MSVGREIPSSERSLFSSSVSTRVAAFLSELEVSGEGGVATAVDCLNDSTPTTKESSKLHQVFKNNSDSPTSIRTSVDDGGLTDLVPVMSASW